MTRCASCGKRIWGSAVQIPGYGYYHAECARLTGLLHLLETDLDRDRVKRRLEELERKIALLQMRRAKGEAPEALDEEWNRLHREMEEVTALARRIQIIEEIERKGA